MLGGGLVHGWAATMCKATFGAAKGFPGPVPHRQRGCQAPGPKLWGVEGYGVGGMVGCG